MENLTNNPVHEYSSSPVKAKYQQTFQAHKVYICIPYTITLQNFILKIIYTLYRQHQSTPIHVQSEIF